jgi:hypothetical protein
MEVTLVKTAGPGDRDRGARQNDPSLQDLLARINDQTIDNPPAASGTLESVAGTIPGQPPVGNRPQHHHRNHYRLTGTPPRRSPDVQR